MEGVCGSVGGCWKGLGIGSPLKCLWNWEAESKRCQRCLRSELAELRDSFGVENRLSPDSGGGGGF